MDRADYTARVLAQLRHVTGEEQAAIRAEIDGHMEDHICALLDLGYDLALAEERTMSAMGDPAEVGRELNKQYPLGWLVLGRLAAWALALLCSAAMLNVHGVCYWVSDNLQGRFCPTHGDRRWEEHGNLETDLRISVGDDILRIYGTGTEDGTAYVYWCQYDESPFGKPGYQETLKGITLLDSRGEKVLCIGSGGPWMEAKCVLQRRDPWLVFRLDREGERTEVRMPLKWEETP